MRRAAQLQESAAKQVLSEVASRVLKRPIVSSDDLLAVSAECAAASKLDGWGTGAAREGTALGSGLAVPATATVAIPARAAAASAPTLVGPAGVLARPTACGTRGCGGGGGESPSRQGEGEGTSCDWWGSLFESDEEGGPALAAAGAGAARAPSLSPGAAARAKAASAKAVRVAKAQALLAVRDPACASSPLATLSAYRLAPAFGAPPFGAACGAGKASRKAPFTGPCGAARLSPLVPLCRFELGGECRDASCSAQHRRDYLRPPAVLLAELQALAEGAAPEIAPAASAPRASAVDVAAADRETGNAAEELLREVAARARAAMSGADVSAPALSQVLCAWWGRQRSRPPDSSGDSGGASSGTGDPNPPQPVSAACLPQLRPAEAPAAPADGTAMSQLPLLQAALRLLPRPSPLAVDIHRQLAPLLLRQQSAVAEALRATADANVPPPSPLAAPPPRQGVIQALAPDLVLRSDGGANLPTWEDDAAVAAIMGPAGGAAAGSRVDGVGGCAAEFWATIERWRRELPQSTAERRGRLLIERALAAQPQSEALWLLRASLRFDDWQAARAEMAAACAAVPNSLVLWHVRARLERTVVGRAETHAEAIRTIALCPGSSWRQHCALLLASLSLIDELVIAGELDFAAWVAAALLRSEDNASEPEPNASIARRAQALSPLPAVASALPVPLRALLWLSRIELRAFGEVSVSRAAAASAFLRASLPLAIQLPWTSDTRSIAGAEADPAGVTQSIDLLFGVALAAADAGGGSASGGLWCLQLNQVMFELSRGEAERASALCQRYIKAAAALEGAHLEALWRLYAHVLAAAPSLTPSLSLEPSLSAEQLLWRARLSAAAAQRRGSVARYDLWHALLCASMTQPEALQVLGLAVATSFDEGEPRAKTLLAACAPPRAGWQPSAAEVKACEALFALLLSRHAAGDGAATPGPVALPREAVGDAAAVGAAGSEVASGPLSPGARGGAALHLLWCAWLRLTATPERVVAAFEAAIRIHGSGVASMELWLHYVRWARSISRCERNKVEARFRRVLAERLGEVAGGGKEAGLPASGEDADGAAGLCALLEQCEPLGRLATGCGLAAARCREISRRSSEYLHLAGFDEAEADWEHALDAESHRAVVLGGGGALLREHAAQDPPALSLRAAAKAALCGHRAAARAILVRALESDPGCIVAWDLAIWNEAADAQWEAAAALAHVAVAVNYTSATLWQQWQRLEGLRENTEAQLRLRALASAAGVRTLTEGASTADSHVPG